MDWYVPKTGAEMFDMLHAAGISVAVACASKGPVKLCDQGAFYQLHHTGRKLPVVFMDALAQILRLPSMKSLRVQARGAVTAPVGNLDGLLAARFTTRGARTVSVRDLLGKQRLNSAVAGESLHKVKKAVMALEGYLRHTSRHTQQGWLADAYPDYDAIHIASPEPVAKDPSDLSIPMPLDPAFGYSTRRPVSDNAIADKTNVAIHGARYASLFAYIGAARFLRAQRVSGNQVNFYVGLAERITIYPDTVLPVLYSVSSSSLEALICRWLELVHNDSSAQPAWRGLTYHVMQTQGVRQSISVERGYLDASWLRSVGKPTIGHWSILLNPGKGPRLLETDSLADSLADRDGHKWMMHLREKALLLGGRSKEIVRPYSWDEVKEVTFTMLGNAHLPLSAVLQREQGTLRFGRALRLFGQFNHGRLRDLIDMLDAVQTQDQLLSALGCVAEECQLAEAKTKLIIVPSDDDLRLLLDDVDQYSARTVAELLIILSSLRYPAKSQSSALVNADSSP